MIHALLTLELQWQVMTPFRFLLALEFLDTRSVFVLFCFFFNRLRKLAPVLLKPRSWHYEG